MVVLRRWVMDERTPEAAPPLFPEPAAKRAAPRLRLAERHQGVIRTESLDERLDADHEARLVWLYVEKLDLTPLLEQIQAVRGGVGRNANDPRILLALWLMASIDGISSARELDKMCGSHRAYEWLCGGVTVNYHTLSDFRGRHAAILDALFAQSIAALTKEGLVDLTTVAQDGMRIRASAGSDSFRRTGTLEDHLRRAEEHLEKLNAEREAESPTVSARQAAARRRAAREKLERLQRAIEHGEEMEAAREKRKAGDGKTARASSTDPEARRMKMPDGGTRPAINAQFATDTESGLVVGVAATNAGNDAKEFKPMLEQIEKNTGAVPTEVLLDGGYNTRENVEAAAEKGTVLFAPVKKAKKLLAAGKDPYAPRRGDSEAMKA